jgi:hypothetical protein
MGRRSELVSSPTQIRQALSDKMSKVCKSYQLLPVLKELTVELPCS